MRALLENLMDTSPSLVIGFATAILGVLVALNVPLTGDQQRAVLALVAAAFALAQALANHKATVSPADAAQAVKDAGTPGATP